MRSIILFAKSPVPGHVKTRLCPPLSHDQAARLYRGMARDCWAAATKAAGKDAVVALDSGARMLDVSWLSPTAKAIRQKGAGLGARMSAAFSAAFLRGCRRVLIIGSDCPEVSASELKKAFEKLADADLVLGPAQDGGYYLIGLKEPCPALFKEMKWSRPDVLKKTLERAAALGLSCAFLRRRADVDVIKDLKALRRRGAPRWTRAALKAWGLSA